MRIFNLLIFCLVINLLCSIRLFSVLAALAGVFIEIKDTKNNANIITVIFVVLVYCFFI